MTWSLCQLVFWDSGSVCGLSCSSNKPCGKNQSGISLFTVSHDAAGDVELVNGVAPGGRVKLVPYVFPAHLDFLELSFTPGETSATVRTNKPLDADVLAAVSFRRHLSAGCDQEV